MTKNFARLVLALGLIAAVFGIGNPGVSSAAPGDIITLDPNTTYQTISGWEVVAQTDFGPFGASRYKTQNDDGDPNNINPDGFQFAKLDYYIDTVVVPMKQLVEANGEELYVNLNFVDWGNNNESHLILQSGTMSTISIGTGQAALGDTVSIDVTVDLLPAGISGFDMDIEIVNPAKAIITGVNFSPNFALTNENLKVDGSTVRIIGVDLGDFGMVGPGDTNVLLATLRVQGLAEGVTTIQVRSMNRMDDDEGSIIPVVSSPGSFEVLNSPPVVNAGPDAVLALGDTFNGTGTINDPGDNVWTGTVDYGDGTIETLSSIVGTAFSLSHTYQNAGLYVVTVNISDDEGAFGADTLQVEVTKIYITLPGLLQPARDLNGDGLAEDINGNGRLDFDDIVKLFKNINTQIVIDNSLDFDFNGNGQPTGVDFDDIVQLFMILVSKFG